MNPLLVKPEEDVFGGLMAGMTPKEAGDLAKSGVEYAGGLLDNIASSASSIAEKAPGSLGRAWHDSKIRSMAQDALDTASYYAGPHLSDRAAAIPAAAAAATENLFGNKDAREASAAFKEGKVGQGAKLLGLGSASALLDVPTLGTGSGMARGLLRGLTKAAHYTPDLSMAIAPIKAFHGSPHDFDKFDLKKIGTGEGAQAYGHGLYFAGNEDVARQYRDVLTPRSAPLTYEGHDFEKIPNAPPGLAARLTTLFPKYTAPEKAIADKARELEVARAAGKTDDVNYFQQQLEYMQSIRDKVKAPQGRMYEVGIHADPETLLDWDRPLREQPKVMEALNPILPKTISGLRPGSMVDPVTRGGAVKGEGVWQALASKKLSLFPDATGKEAHDAALSRLQFGPTGMSEGRAVDAKAATAQALREAGIPGIKYLDAGSRNSAGEQTRNYVTFSDDIVEILRKYGLAGAGVGLGGAMAMQPGLFPLPQQQ